ncbi:hypothetical protein ACF0H5_010880 [Mactra antiquata]
MSEKALDIQKPRLGWNAVIVNNKANSRSSSPVKTSNRDSTDSPALSNNRPSVQSRNSVHSVDGDGVRKSSRKDSVRMFGDLAMLGEIQSKMSFQGKLLQMKAQIRKDAVTKGGVKNILNAPKVIRAFRSQVSVCIIL